MQVRCIKAFGSAVPGDVADVPDGGSTDPEHWEIVTAAPAAATTVPADKPAAPVLKDGV